MEAGRLYSSNVLKLPPDHCVCPTELEKRNQAPFCVLHLKNQVPGNSLAVQWLGLHTFMAEGAGSTPGQGTKIPQASQCGQNNKK